jgi:peptide/nickel transport system permease protein
MIAALRHNTWIDRTITTLAFMGFSTPPFFSGLVLIIVLSVRLGWLPFIYDNTLVVNDLGSLGQWLRQSIMPIATLVLFQTAMLLRFVRAAMLEEIPQNYVKTARAKGLGRWRIVTLHMLRNALIPVVTLVALDIPTIFTGALVTEQVFRVPGIGALLIESIYRSDTPVVMGIAFVYAVLVVGFNLVADLLYGVIDPRVRYGH